MLTRLFPLLFASLAGCSRLIPESPGAPIGDSMSAGPYIATLVYTGVGRVPELHRDPEKDRFRLSLLLISRDGSERRLIPLASSLRSGEFIHSARFLGVKESVVYFHAHEPMAYDFQFHRLVSPSGAPSRPMSLSRSNVRDLYAPVGQLCPDCTRPSLLRSAPHADPVQLANPASQLVIFHSNTAHLTRVTPDGRRLWTTDTTLLDVDQILPGDKVTALIGRPPAAKPDAFRQPVLILIDNASGSLTPHPLTHN